MQKEEITQYIVNALGRHHSRSDIVQHLCEQTGMPWSEAEKLVRQVEISHSAEIDVRQSPLIIGLGIMAIIGGIGLIAFCAFYFIGFIPKDAPSLVQRGRGAYAAIVALVAGIGMVTGAVIGMWRTIKELFEDKDHR